MKPTSLGAALILALLVTAPLHPARAGAPTDVETPVGTFQRVTADYWITEPAIDGEAAITWKQVRSSGGLLELHETKNNAVLMFDLKDRIVVFVQKVAARKVKPVAGARLAIFASGSFFVEGPGQRWIERPDTGAARTWTEVERDEWSIYLRSEQDGAEAQLDLYQARLTITDETTCSTPCTRPLLTAGTAHPITRLVSE